MFDVDATLTLFSDQLAYLRTLRECHAITEIERMKHARALLDATRAVAVLARDNSADEGERLVAGLQARFCEDESKGAEVFVRDRASGGFAPGYLG
jgi:hypothetical protein